MHSYNMKKAMRFPRCLNCDSVLFLRSALGKQRKYIKCGCGIEYARAAIKDADPERWNYVRKHRNFELKETENGVIIIGHGGLGSRRITT